MLYIENYVTIRNGGCGGLQKKTNVTGWYLLVLIVLVFVTNDSKGEVTGTTNKQTNTKPHYNPPYTATTPPPNRIRTGTTKQYHQFYKQSPHLIRSEFNNDAAPLFRTISLLSPPSPLIADRNVTSAQDEPNNNSSIERSLKEESTGGDKDIGQTDAVVIEEEPKPTSEATTTTVVHPSHRPSSVINGQTTCSTPLTGNLDYLTQDQFFTALTHECRYDRLIKPLTQGPLNMTMQLEIRHIEAVEHLFKMHLLVQYRYIDHRLEYEKVSPSRDHMIGEDKLREKIWIPHIILRNERDTSIMGIEGKDIFISVSPQGEVIYSYRMTAQIYCWMNLQKFPFDEQVCDVIFKSWTYNSTQLLLQWESEMPFIIASQLHLTEFSLTGNWTYSDFEISPRSRRAFVGNYSILMFKFQVSREAGFYFMDYFLPSIMIVCTSWVSFWLQADNAAPRVTLGTSTMLSFITLASGQSKTLPKVSYIKASEIWFLGCTAFIFLSIAEFAFVNIVWRRSKKVELKKVNSKYILKSTLTPKMARRDLHRSNSMNNLHKSRSCSSLDVSKDADLQNPNGYNNYLTVHSFPSTLNIPTITMQSEDDLLPVGVNRRPSVTSIAVPTAATAAAGINTSSHSNNNNNNNNFNQLDNRWTTMTPQEVAIWIDKRSRIAFPVMFLVFNIFYWSFVYAL